MPSSVAFAYEPWDVEDPCVAANEDFYDGRGWENDTDVVENHFYGDGYNLYRDDKTDTGDLDRVRIRTTTPSEGEIDLPFARYNKKKGLWIYIDKNPNTWYWALEPRGYNLPPAPNEAYNRYKGLSGVFWVEVLNFSGFDTYKWDEWGSFDRVLAEDVVAYNRVNGLICTLYIPEGTHLSYPARPYTLVTNLFVEKDDDGGVYFDPGNMDFSQPCSMKLAHPDGTEEVVTFTQIRDGLPVE